MTTTAKDRALLLLTLVTLAASAGVFVLAAGGRFAPRVAETEPGESLYREVVRVVMRDYVVEPDQEKIAYGAVKGILAELDDPHAKAFPPAEWEVFRQEASGESVGVGLELVSLGEALVVAHVGHGSPAEAAGVRAGERVLEVAGKKPRDSKGLGEAERDLRGPAKTRVALVVSARDGGGARSVVLERAPFDATPVYGRMLDGDQVGRIRIASFRSGTAEAFKREVEALKRRGMKALIVDLRFNRGGSFDSAVAVADQWLTEGAICSTLGRNRSEVFNATPEAPLSGVPTVVLVNGLTASAAEVLAGALQDSHEALLFGEPTYGKGVVQEVLPFKTWAGGMKLTVAHYFTPAGRAVESRPLQKGGGSRGGLDPDVRIRTTDAARDRLKRALDRFHWNEEVRAEAEAFESSLEPNERDETSLAALRLLGGTGYDAPSR